MSPHHKNHIIQPFSSSSSYDQSPNRFQTPHHHQQMITDAEKIDINPSGSRSWGNKEDKNDKVKEGSSNMRMMRKMEMVPHQTMHRLQDHHLLSSSDHDINCNSSCSSNQTYDTSIRVCVDCHTTKTPLWRTGPTGPKSLCNACGIRRRKERRAMVAMAAPVRENKKEKKKVGEERRGGGKKKIDVEELGIRVRKNMCQADEKEAAILLMALSYGTALVLPG